MNPQSDIDCFVDARIVVEHQDPAAPTTDIIAEASRLFDRVARDAKREVLDNLRSRLLDDLRSRREGRA
jgi:hypothetical protein